MRTESRRSAAVLATGLVALLVLASPSRAVPACAGDCDLNGIVSSDDIAGGAELLLATAGASPCPGADADGSGTVTVRDLVLGLRVRRDGCIVDLLVTGRVLFDDGSPVAGASVTAEIADPASLQAARLASIAQSVVMNQEGKPVPITQASFGEPLVQFLAQVPTVTDAQGNYSITLPQQLLPVRVTLDVSHEPEGLPRIDSARTRDATTPVLAAGDIVLPNAATAEIALSAGRGSTPNGDIIVDEMPPEITKFWARGYDPDTEADAFPGDFTESGGRIQLNSAQFTWAEAQDAAGDEVSELMSPAKIQAQVPTSQWADLEDVIPGTDRIEVPIYKFNEVLQMWEQMGLGWLQDEAGTILPEDAQDVILDGSLGGKLYATYQTSHFSWMNVDYAFIGPWKLSCLARERRNNDCLYQALQLAKTILRSAKGRAAYARVNLPGVDINTEVPDNGGPSLCTSALDWTNDSQTNGEYDGDAAGGHEDRLALNDTIWGFCDQEGKKKDIILLLASTILHETAHWKDDVKKHPGASDTTAPDGPLDTRGEEGKQLEKDLFGGDLHFDPVDGRLEIDRAAATEEQKDAWLDPANWPATAPAPGLAPVAAPSPLEIAIAIGQPSYALGEAIPVTVTYRNVGTEPISVLGMTLLEDYPIRFDIVRDGTERTVGYLGPEADTGVTPADFVTLQPNETLQRVFDLVHDEQGRLRRYSLRVPGDYAARAVYAPFFGLPETQSDALTFAITPGGSLGGLVRRAENGQVLAGATVRAYLAGTLVASAMTGGDGTYLMENLPVGSYRVEARAPGYLRSVFENVGVTAGQQATADFSLSPLLAEGELRFVLTWGAAPGDLDSHTWLPADRKYHVYYSRRGAANGCPFAFLDTDDTSGYGPETTTIAQRIGQGTYTYAIYNYSGSPDITASEARVQVFDRTGLLATIEIPTEGTGRWWKVLTFDSTTGEITEINEIMSSPEPYYDSTEGCPPELCDDQGVDEDEDGNADCADSDCTYQDPCIEEGADECGDGQDNDADGLLDCDDADYCVNQDPCIEDGADECGDTQDNDGDGLIDCADTAYCYYQGPCIEDGEDECSDQADNDGDGLIDCADTAYCYATDACTEQGDDECADGQDNDGDDVVDCFDTQDCAWSTPCREDDLARCHDDQDNDKDGQADCDDYDCYGACQEAWHCADGGDNDRDGLTDCDDYDDCAYYCPEARCADGIDDDGDGTTDCADYDCWDAPNCTGDGDGDGVPSDGNLSGVAGDARCTGGQAAGCDDNCPQSYNPGQEDGNGNGIGDACEAV